MLTDTHCHILSTEYYNPQSIIDNWSSSNIKRIIINGYNQISNEEVLKLINNQNVYGALGIHPDNISLNLDKELDYITQNINTKGIIAIGEIGLDYYHNDQNKEEQIKLLDYFLTLAENNNLPVIIHNRNATDDLLKILKRHHNKGIIHCFSGSLETATEFIKLGFKLGIGGVVTFKNSNLPQTLSKINIENILLETDSPYLSPAPLRGTINEPLNLNIIEKKICEIYSLSPEKVENILESNFNDIFDIKNQTWYNEKRYGA